MHMKRLKIPKRQSESIIEGQTTQCPAEKDKRTSNELTKDGAIGTSRNSGDELRCSGSVSSFCSTNDTRRAT